MSRTFYLSIFRKQLSPKAIFRMRWLTEIETSRKVTEYNPQKTFEIFFSPVLPNRQNHKLKEFLMTFWTTFILITKLKSCILIYWHIDILTYWHIDILTCWHIDIRTYWHTEILFSDILLTFWTTFLLITKLRIDLKFWPHNSFWGGHQDL